MKRNRPVTQLDEWGCGVACVASYLELSYGEAKTHLERYKRNLVDPDPKDMEIIARIAIKT
jgi:hypothetical protein